jgi:hypothetical protein
MDIRTSHFQVERLPNRVKEVWFPNVPGHSTVDMGESLYEIRQSGLMDISPQAGPGAGTGSTGIAILLGLTPAIMGGRTLVTVDTSGQGVFNNCRCIRVNTERNSYRTVRYEVIWRQTTPGAKFDWPD